MCHPLTSLHTLISVQLNESHLSPGSGSSFPQEDCKEVLRLIAQSESDLLQSVLSAGNPAAAAAVVQTYQIACTSLADFVYRYRCRNNYGRKKAKEDENRKYQVIEENLLKMLRYVQHHFPSFCDKSQPVSLCEWNAVKASFLERKEALENGLKGMQLTEAEKAWVLKPAADILTLADSAPSYERSIYLTRYLSCWEKALQGNILSVAEVLQSMISLNYNEPSFISYFITHLYQQMEEGTTLFGEVAYWSEQLLLCNRIGLRNNLAWLPSLPSAKETVLSTIQKEIDIRMNQLPYLKQIESQSPAGFLGAQPLAVTSLSVSQLAVLVRLLNECSLIKCDNQSAFFKGLVSAIRTEKTTKLSAESLRCKYYAPERPAIAIVKDYLFRMMNQLKDL